jgi:ribosomal subunit interface protein
MALESEDKEITVQSANVTSGERMPEYAREAIRKVAAKYFGRLNTASVHVTREGISYRCSVNMQMGALPMKSAEGRGKDVYLAFGDALNKVAKQLRRAKREVREDKAERTDKEAVLNDGLRGGG